MTIQLSINGNPQVFIPIKVFRTRHNLPETFSLNTLQPKTRPDLAKIDRAGPLLIEVRDRLLAAMPTVTSPTDWLAIIPQIAVRFEAELYRINADVGLREEEIAFAVNGFTDVLSAMAFAIIRAKLTHHTMPVFEAVYHQWLDDSLSIGGAIQYPHQNTIWTLRIITNAYGRIGLEVNTTQATYYVLDKSLACPVDGYMMQLLQKLTHHMIAT